MAIVEFRDVWYRYPASKDWVLRGVTLEIPRGRTLIAGPTGSGKSTILRVASGAVEIYGGVLQGRVERRAPVMLVPQVFDMFILNMTVLDEIIYSLENAGIPPGDARREARRIAEEVGVDHLLGKRVAELSAGERQRVALASAIAWGARVLMLDEPLAYLDPAGARSLLSLLSRLDLDAVVVAEHRLHLMESWPDRVAVVEDGRVKAVVEDPRKLPDAAPAGGGAGLWGVWSARTAIQAAGCAGGDPGRHRLGGTGR